jgi:hypothetical protein
VACRSPSVASVRPSAITEPPAAGRNRGRTVQNRPCTRQRLSGLAVRDGARPAPSRQRDAQQSDQDRAGVGGTRAPAAGIRPQ